MDESESTLSFFEKWILTPACGEPGVCGLIIIGGLLLIGVILVIIWKVKNKKTPSLQISGGSKGVVSGKNIDVGRDINL